MVEKPLTQGIKQKALHRARDVAHDFGQCLATVTKVGRCSLMETGTSAEVMARRRMVARRAYAEAQADKQINIAALAKTRQYREWTPGELACYWCEPLSRKRGRPTCGSSASDAPDG